MIVLYLVLALLFIDAYRTAHNIQSTPASSYRHHWLSERLYGDLIALCVMAFLIAAAIWLPN